MATLPTLEQGGSVYRILLWSSDTGGIPFVIGTPETPNVATPEFEARLWEFAQALAADLDCSITAIKRAATAETELEWPV
jgi:hypothetical protein